MQCAVCNVHYTCTVYVYVTFCWSLDHTVLILQMTVDMLTTKLDESWLRYNTLMIFQSKKRGLSVEEKRTRMMEFFYEKVEKKET